MIRDLSIDDVKTAQRNYDAICAAEPWTHMDAYGHPLREKERRQWIEKKARVKIRLDNAKAFALFNPKPVVAPRRSFQPRKPSLKVKTVEELVEGFKEKVRQLETLTPGTTDYRRVRDQAIMNRCNLRERCREEFVPYPVLPELPSYMLTRRPKPCAPPLANPVAQERREKDRERKRAKRVAEASGVTP